MRTPRRPACGLHELGQRRALGALHHGDHFRLFVGAVRLWLGGRLLRPRRLLRGQGLLGVFALALGLRQRGRLLVVSLSIESSPIEFLLDRVTVVTFITPVGRNSKQNLSAIRHEADDWIGNEAIWRAWSLFLCTRQNQPRSVGLCSSGPRRSPCMKPELQSDKSHPHWGVGVGTIHRTVFQKPADLGLLQTVD